jgi:DNA helicase HerA-like ATPase
MVDNTLLIGFNAKGEALTLPLKMANRHGLIAGATGTGKTVTLQKLAEGFSRQGVAVFLADVKGDLSGLCEAAGKDPKIQERIQKLKITDFQPKGCQAVYWDLYGKRGHPLRATISEMGPLLLSRLLDLNDTQESVLQVVFKIADDQGLLLLDVKDLKSMLAWVGDHAKELKEQYGNISTATIDTIQRQLLVLSEAGGEYFFTEPALKLEHLLQTDSSGNGVISVLDATTLMRDPRIYVSFMLYLLSELFEKMPEIGDPERPKLVFFFDEAHLLFKDASPILLQKIEQVVRLIRSKGVGVYFATQNPLDIPDTVLGQLGHRVQHALRSFTPQDQKVVKTVAQTFRQNPAIDTETAISQLGVGEALVSVLAVDGTPTPVDRILVAPPESRIGPLTDAERAQQLQSSPLAGVYDQTIDRESAFELLKKRQTQLTPAPASQVGSAAGSMLKSFGQQVLRSTATGMGFTIGNEIVRGLMGSIFGGSSGRRRGLF